MTNADARYAARKMRELLRLVARHIRTDAHALLARSQIERQEARHMLDVCRALER